MATTTVRTTSVIKITGTTAAAEEVTPNDVIIKKIVWYAATTNAHKLSLTDKNGVTIYLAQMATTALTENIEADFPGGLNAQGISVDDLDSGTVLIYI